MDLQHLGFDEWFSGHASRELQPGQSLARVMTVDRGAYLVRDESRDIPAELSGRFRRAVESTTELPCVGDWVCVEFASPDLAIIHSVLPRKSVLRRKSAGNTVDFQMIAANVDVTFVVQSCHYDFNVRRLDRYLVACHEGGIEPVIILSKTDMLPPDEVDGLILDMRGAGILARIIPLSNTTGDGLGMFRSLPEPGKTYCLVGSSGVGKSTLVNRLLGRDELATKAVSASGEGMHTTSRRQLHVLENGAMLVDTPGMREFGLLGTGQGLDDNFSDIRDIALECRFANCTHTQEPGCAILEAIKTGKLSEERFQSYLKLKKESDHHNLSQLEQRRKDKDFSRSIKSVMKHRKR
jgi:ribosome biogenesis GTPase